MVTRRRLGIIVGAGIVFAMAWVALTWPTTTRFGINAQLATRTLPLYLKALEFVDRDAQYRRVAADISRGRSSDRDRMLAVYDWTRRNIRRPPEGWPIVDDHIFHIMVRGYGAEDQMADVFTTLCTYSGVPAYWLFVSPPMSRARLTISFAQVDGRWAVIDVYNGFVFLTDAKELATATDLVRDPGILRRTAGDLRLQDIPYERFFARFREPVAPRPTRAELQMPWRRLWHVATGGSDDKGHLEGAPDVSQAGSGGR